MNIIFDWKRTLYDPDNKKMIRGSRTLLDTLYKTGHNMLLIGKGDAEMYDEVERLKVKKYFSRIIFQEGTKDIEVFKPLVKGKTVVIGDRCRSELEIGNKLGATTIWIKQGKFANEIPENDMQKPTYVITSLKWVLETLTRII